ncbi:MAG TPA: hypothetical protein VEW42_05485 [Candidatus Eisenbacteria bacterium]|nr:hypothetical protein [Candidatus Eisenbacteria bacterium]
MQTESTSTPEQPFRGIKLYFSGSIGGIEEADYELPEQLTGYMQEKGATILDPQVAISARRKPDEFRSAMLGVQGISSEEWDQLSPQEKDLRIYRKDMSLVDQATHVVALVNGISFGVGMELQRALDKPTLGKNLTPILGLIHTDNIDELSYRMIRGAAQKYPHFQLKTYASFEDATRAIHEFLAPPTQQIARKRR